MSLVNRRKHMIREVLREPLRAPGERQRVARVVAGRGNNLHEVETPDGERFLASMPTRYRRSLWIKRRDFVLLDPIDEGDKVKGEIALVLTGEHRRFYRQNGWWPTEFGLTATDGSASGSSSEGDPGDSSDDDLGLPRNLNRPPPAPAASSSSSSTLTSSEEENEESGEEAGPDANANPPTGDGDASSSDTSFASFSSSGGSDVSTESARGARLPAMCRQEE